jgi:hypothetical protein
MKAFPRGAVTVRSRICSLFSCCSLSFQIECFNFGVLRFVVSTHAFISRAMAARLWFFV